MTETMDVHEELKAIRTDLDYIKEHMVDVDTVLTPKEKERLDESIKEYKSGKAVSLEDFEKNV
jgi:hypothetical protein